MSLLRITSSFQRSRPFINTTDCCSLSNLKSYFVLRYTSVATPSEGVSTNTKVHVSSPAQPRSTSLPTDEGLDPPIQFTTSEASQWKATETLLLKRRGPEPPWIQTYCVVLPLAALLIWFGILREENDIDEEMKKPLWERIPGLEKSQLLILLKHNKSHGMPSDDIEARLAEIKEMERKASKK